MNYSPQLVPTKLSEAGTLPVSEIFLSIQGEGRSAGTKALFVRLAYCNLGCSWCDTRFTWEQGKLDTIYDKTCHEIANNAVRLVADDGTRPGDCHIVITGGEPLLHQLEICKLIDELRCHGFHFFEIETNGAIVPLDSLLDRISWWNCSPKLSNSGLERVIRINSGALEIFGGLENLDFKFVVGDTSDLDEIQHDFAEYCPAEKVMLMPEGKSPNRILERASWITEQCIKHRFRFSSRLHILLWGNERGK